MERSQGNRTGSKGFGNESMTAIEQARAVEGMHQALLLGTLTLAAMMRVRNAFSQVMGRNAEAQNDPISQRNR